MRKTAAAIATAVLVTTTLTPSPAGAQTPEEAISQISCGTVGPPLCDAVDQVLALLAPLQPLLELAGPALGDLGAAANQLTALLEAGPDLPPKEVAAAAASLLHEIDGLTGGLLDLLRGAGVDVSPLRDALGQVRELVLAPLAPAAGPAAAPSPAAGAAAGPTQTSASTSAPTGFGSPLSSGAPVNSPAVPDVPAGSTLQLGPLTLPPFSFSTTPAVTAEELVAEQAVTELIAPAVAAAAAAPAEDDGSGRATAIVLAMSLLMLAVGLLLDQAHKVRQPVRV